MCAECIQEMAYQFRDGARPCAVEPCDLRRPCIPRKRVDEQAVAWQGVPYGVECVLVKEARRRCQREKGRQACVCIAVVLRTIRR